MKSKAESKLSPTKSWLFRTINPPVDGYAMTKPEPLSLQLKFDAWRDRLAQPHALRAFQLVHASNLSITPDASRFQQRL